MNKKPEEQGPPQQYYNAENAELYAQNARTNDVQIQLTDRALELLDLQEQGLLLLDIGCGTGISTSYLNECGYMTAGVDIAIEMLKYNETDNLLQIDIGETLPFQPGTFDGAVSISVLQWLCYSNNTNEDPFQRLFGFFTNLYGALKPNARAVFQFYPENDQQLQLIQDAADKAGFRGDLIIDFPNSAKAKKMYLVLYCGLTAAVGQYKNKLKSEQKHGHKQQSYQVRSTKMEKGSREWILQKKAKRAQTGEEVGTITKYTGRKRHGMWK